MKIYFHGCRTDKGHFLYKSGDSSYKLGFDLSKILGRHLDSGFAPCDRLTGGYEEQFKAMITWTSGYTVIAFWDRTIDQRHASNSAFVVDENMCFANMVPLCKDAFPEVFARYHGGLHYINGKTLAEHIKDGDYRDPYKQT